MDRTPPVYLYVLNDQFKVLLGPGAGPGPLARFFTEDSSINELPAGLLAVVRRLNASSTVPAATTYEGLDIELLQMDGTGGPHLGVLIAAPTPMPQSG